MAQRRRFEVRQQPLGTDRKGSGQARPADLPLAVRTDLAVTGQRIALGSVAAIATSNGSPRLGGTVAAPLPSFFVERPRPAQ